MTYRRPGRRPLIFSDVTGLYRGGTHGSAGTGGGGQRAEVVTGRTAGRVSGVRRRPFSRGRRVIPSEINGSVGLTTPARPPLGTLLPLTMVAFRGDMRSAGINSRLTDEEVRMAGYAAAAAAPAAPVGRGAPQGHCRQWSAAAPAPEAENVTRRGVWMVSWADGPRPAQLCRVEMKISCSCSASSSC